MTFWQYACEVYQKPSVEPQLLILQNQHHWVVSHVLLAAWSSHHGRVMDWTELFLVEENVGLQCRLVEPIRHFRQAAKAHVSAELYQQLKSLELSAERQHMEWLESVFDQVSVVSSGESEPDLFLKNLSGYRLTKASLDASSELEDELSLLPLIKGLISAVLG